jgi:hypothetical protein
MEWFKWVERERGGCKACLPLFERGRGESHGFRGLSAEVECREFHGLREEEGNATWFQLVRDGLGFFIDEDG